ncbi:MAG TPA: AAA family ATPase, partial [Sphingomonadaceae bacterium]|nr:AAA family ATPase [Sphingomonadaceae bacterium]
DGFAREFFDQTFSVDREQLEKGGDQILEGKGDLGQLLFAGSTGLQGLPERLAALDTEASQLWKPRGDTKIRVLIDQIKAIDDRIDAIKTTQRTYDDAVRDVTRLQIAYDEVLARRGLRSKAIRESEIWLRAFTPYREHQRARAKLEDLGSGETARPEDLERVHHALQESARLDAMLSAARSTYDEIAAQLDALPQPDPIAAHAPAIEDLRNRAVEARKERSDRPNREREVAESQATIERIGRELGLEAGAASRDLMIATRETTRLSSLLTDEARSRSALRQAEAEVARAETLVSEGARSLEALGPAVDQTELRSVLRSADNVDLGVEYRRLSGDQAQKTREHSDTLAAHMLTGADAEARFLSLVLPEDAEIERLGMTLRSTEQALSEASANLRAGLQAVDAAEQDLAALSDVQAISDEVLLNAKAARDAVVGALVGPMDESDLLECRTDLAERIRKTDEIYDERIGQADALSDLKAKTVSRDRAALKLTHLEQEKAVAEMALSAARDAVRSVSPSGFAFRDIAHIRAVAAD